MIFSFNKTKKIRARDHNIVNMFPEGKLFTILSSLLFIIWIYVLLRGQIHLFFMLFYYNRKRNSDSGVPKYKQNYQYAQITFNLKEHIAIYFSVYIYIWYIHNAITNYIQFERTYSNLFLCIYIYDIYIMPLRITFNLKKIRQSIFLYIYMYVYIYMYYAITSEPD